MSRRGVAAAGAALLALLGAGCGSPNTPAAPAPEPLPVAPELVTQREQAGIADCPATDADADAVPGGLPDLVLGCLGSGRQVNLAALRGRPMVVNVWAQWCAPCRAEAPHLREFNALAGERVLVLGIDFSDPDQALAMEFASYAGWSHPHVTDPLKQTAGPLGLSGIPVTLFVDAQGRVVHRTVGAVGSTRQLVDDTREYLGVDL